MTQLNLVSGFGSNAVDYGKSVELKMVPDEVTTSTRIPQIYVSARTDDESGRLRIRVNGLAPVFEDEPFELTYLDGYGNEHTLLVNVANKEA